MSSRRAVTKLVLASFISTASLPALGGGVNHPGGSSLQNPAGHSVGQRFPLEELRRPWRDIDKALHLFNGISQQVGFGTCAAQHFDLLR